MAEAEAPKHDNGKPIEKGSEDDCSAGPIPGDKRGCTDIVCIPLFAACWVAFVIVTMAGMADGNPVKLYKPRDFQGAFCGVEKNWNNGPDLTKGTVLAYAMNTTTAAGMVAKEYMCAQDVKDYLYTVMATDAFDEYQCACCHIPCATCVGSLDLGPSSGVSGKMSELSSISGSGLFNPSSSENGQMFTNMWEQTALYFVQVCTSTCDIVGTATTRNYTYSPMPDDPLYVAWRTAGSSDAPSAVSSPQSEFVFQALSEDDCPYKNPAYCVPFPGVGQTEIAGGYCTFELVGAAVAAVGEAAADAFENIGANSLADSATQSFGDMAGDLGASIDALILVCVCSFVIGFVFIVILRFMICIVVWLAIVLIFLVLVVTGAFCFVLSGACKGANLLESGQEQGFAVYTAGSNAATGGDTGSEQMTGNGVDYRGVQDKTRMGDDCLWWSSSADYKPTQHPDSGLEDNYCRNPTTKPELQAPSIWCFTDNSTQPNTWATCSPIGVIQPKCHQGYSIDGATARDIVKYMGYVMWGLALIYLIIVCCLHSRIMLAIRINEVAALFIKDTYSILLLPIVQVVIGVIWIVVWALSASFLISQIPDDAVPKSSMATYGESFGVYEGEDWKPGVCADMWPSGFAWKTLGDPTIADDPCSGNMGDITGIVPMCWRCATPRYYLDWRFAVSFFNFLWNNAFLIAVGQCAVAGAVCVWFFTEESARGTKRAVRTGLYNVFRFHLGSVLFGSFILAVVQFIRYLMKYFEKQAEVQKNKVLVYILKCVQCCIYCFEKCIKFLNKNAYIQVALLGKNFCRSAMNAFMLIARNILRFGVVASLGSIIHSLGVLFITIGTVCVGYLILAALHEDLNPVAPMAIYIVIGYLVGGLFMNVFGLAVDTSLQCFIAAEELGVPDTNVPGPLKSLVNKTKKSAAA